MRNSTGFPHYENTSTNDCGQAALAALLDYWQLNPYHLTRNKNGSYDNLELISSIKKDFPPNVFWGYLGSDFPQLKKALLFYGFKIEAGFGSSTKAQVKVIQGLASKRPALVCLNAGLIGGHPFTAHWTIAYAFNGSEVSITNWHLSNLPWEVFLKAWKIGFAPLAYYHYSYLIPCLDV